MSARDGRSRPWLWVGLDALERVRQNCPSAQVPSVRNVYMALAESATRAFDPNHANFRTTRAEIAHLAGVSTKTVDRACAILVDLGLLEMLPQSDDDGRTLPSVYRMVSGGDTVSPPGDGTKDTESPPITRTGSKAKKEERPTADIAREPQVTFLRKPVPERLATEAVKAVQAWGERTDQKLKAFTARGKQTDSLTRVVGAMLDFPEAIDLWPSMIDAALRDPWWHDSAPGIGVVFGPKAVEQSIQRARQPAIAASAGSNVHRMRPRGGGGTPWSAADMAAIAQRYLDEEAQGTA